MFTSEPSLAQAVERMIADTPLIDPHSQIRPDRAAAPDLAALLDDPGLQTALRAAGMSPKDLTAPQSADDRVAHALPYLRRARNTAPAWAFYRILRDLHDFHEPDLTGSNVADLLEKVAATGRDPAWPSHVLGDRCNLRTLVTPQPDPAAKAPAASLPTLHRLDLQPLFGPAPGGFEAMVALLGDRPSTTPQLAGLVRDALDHRLTGPTRFAHATLAPGQPLSAPDPAAAQTLLNRASGHRDLPDADLEPLTRFTTWEALGWHADRRKAIQLTVTPEPSSPWTSAITRAFRHFAGARFDLLLAIDDPHDHLGHLAAEHPNVSVSGHGPSVNPSVIEALIARRVQTIPMTKLTAFVSDAPTVEWTYARLLLVKRALAGAFSGMIEARAFERHDVPPVLRQILHDTPRDLLDLGPR